MISNKKNRMPQMKALYNGKFPVELGCDVKRDDIKWYVDADVETFNEILGKKKGNFVFLGFTNETVIQNSIIVSRLLAKMVLEALADRLKTLEGSLDELINYKEFNLIRNHARRGAISEWPCSIRRIYGIDDLWKCEDGKLEQKIHESDFLVIDKGGKGEIRYVILYFVIVLWGMEFAINMAEPEIEGYNNWVNQHNRLSPLYVDQNTEK